MRRADRLFDIIQTLRAAPRPLTAAALADRLEVTVRTIYRGEPDEIVALEVIDAAPPCGEPARIT